MADEGLSESAPLCISVGLAPSIPSGCPEEPAAPARPNRLADAVTGGPGSPGWGIIGMGGAWPACGSCCACICCCNRNERTTYVFKCVYYNTGSDGHLFLNVERQKKKNQKYHVNRNVV